VRVLGDYIMCNKNCNDDEEEVVTNAIINHHLPEFNFVNNDEETGLDLKGKLYYDEESGKWKSR
tara:strand:+ start:216 stop:407 length:192 start_codon:yes stop_codon:yes gene_type:complete